MNHFKKIVTVIKLHEKDLERFMEVIKLFEVVFEMEPFPIPASAHLQKLLGKSDFFVFAAIIENKLLTFTNSPSIPIIKDRESEQN